MLVRAQRGVLKNRDWLHPQSQSLFSSSRVLATTPANVDWLRPRCLSPFAIKRCQSHASILGLAPSAVPILVCDHPFAIIRLRSNVARATPANGVAVCGLIRRNSHGPCGTLHRFRPRRTRDTHRSVEGKAQAGGVLKQALRISQLRPNTACYETEKFPEPTFAMGRDQSVTETCTADWPESRSSRETQAVIVDLHQENVPQITM